MRPEAPFYVGTTRPGAVGWTRVGMNAVASIALMIVMAVQIAPGNWPLLIVVGMVCAGLVLWSWMRLWTRFVVDGRGLTVSWGGFWPQPTWPLSDFRTVQLRSVPSERFGVSVGGVGWRRGRVMTARPEEITPVGSRKPFTLPTPQARFRVLASRPGTMVEIIGRGQEHFLISAEDPQATAAAVDQAIRSRR